MTQDKTRPPRLLIVDDDTSLAGVLEAAFTRERYAVRTASTGAEAEHALRASPPDVVLLDLVLPDANGLDVLERGKQINGGCQFVILSGHGSVKAAVDAVKKGAYGFLEKPADLDALVALVDRATEKSRLVSENRELRAVADGRGAIDNVIGASPAIRDVLETVQSVASSDANVLINGESGTGKELIANAIHVNSQRADRRFVKINCAAIPKDLIEAELFGYRKGAFTGATQDKEGVFAEAQGGSLLLDEIGEMPPLLQTKLLRVLQEREYRPVGGDRPRKADFRLICTTNVDVNKALKDGDLREDLFFRINTVMIRVPPLRDRPEDLLLLAERFLARFRKRHRRQARRLTRSALDVLRRYSWPGNVRELEGAIEHAVLMAKSDEVTIEDLPEMVRVPQSWSSEFSMPTNLTLAELEKQAILQTLERTGWNKQEAAHRLGLYRPTLYSKMRKHEIIPRPQPKDPAASETRTPAGMQS